MTNETDGLEPKTTIVEPVTKDEFSADTIVEDGLEELIEEKPENPIEESVIEDYKSIGQEAITKKPGLKKRVTLWVVAFFGFIYAAILFIPHLSATLKALGLPDDLPKIKEEISPAKPAPQISVLITPEFENQSLVANEVSLRLANEAKEKNCTSEKENSSSSFVIACDGEIGDKIHFTLSSAGCTDKEDKAQLGYPKKSYIKCP